MTDKTTDDFPSHWFLSSSTSDTQSYFYSDCISEIHLTDDNINTIRKPQNTHKDEEEQMNKTVIFTEEQPCATLSEYRWEEEVGRYPEVQLSFQLNSHTYLEKDLGYVLEDFLNEWLLHYGNYTPEDYLNRRSNKDMKIKDVQILAKDKVVRVVFSDGTSEKAVCNEQDIFSLERAVEICICKYLMGGTANFNKAVRKGLKVYDDKLKAEEIEKAEKERIEKKRAKHNAYRDKCRAKAEKAEKEKQIEIQKEAYLQAMREYKEERKGMKHNYIK